MGTSPEGDQNGQGTGDRESFEARLGAARKKHGLDRSEAAEAAEIRRRGMGAGMRIATEILAALVVGTGAGILIDRWLGISPWGLLVGFVIGCGAAFLNVVRTSRELDRHAKEARQAAEKGRN